VDIKYQDYITAYLKEYIIYDKNIAKEVDEIINKFTNKMDALSLKYHIKNLLPKYPTIYKIVGPTSWSHFRYKGRNIHTFGEYHYKVNRTDYHDKFDMNIVQLFKYISKRSIDEEKTTNFYLEYRYAAKEQRPTVLKESYLKHVVDEFKPCLQRVKTKCPYYPYAKYHYVDIRHSSNNLTILSYITGIPENITKGNQLQILKAMNIFEIIVRELKLRPNLLFEMYIDKDQGKKIYEVFLKRTGINVPISENFKTGTMMHKVRWQLKNIDVNMAQNIRDYSFKIYVEHINELITEMNNKWPVIKNEIIYSQKLESFEIFASNIENITIKIASVFMDTYYLARLFRSMEWDKKCKLFVTYVGDAHKVRYDDFFKSLPDMKLINDVNDPSVELGQYLKALSPELANIDIEQHIFSTKLEKVFGEELFI
jgi:hypothetical protein